jgi:hypothetical protein
MLLHREDRISRANNDDRLTRAGEDAHLDVVRIQVCGKFHRDGAITIGGGRKVKVTDGRKFCDGRKIHVDVSMRAFSGLSAQLYLPVNRFQSGHAAAHAAQMPIRRKLMSPLWREITRHVADINP